MVSLQQRLRIPILCIVSLSFLELDIVTLDNFRPRDLHSVNAEALVGSNVTNISKSRLESLVEYVVETIEPFLDAKDGDDATKEFGLAHHSLDKDIVDLLDWEEQSLAGIMDPNATSQSAYASCHPPPGISQTCCLGSFSTGGGVNYNQRLACAASLQDEAFEELQRHTRNFFEENALPSKDSMACDACRIVDLARKHNLTIALMGDSMHHQIIDGLSCELQRRNYNVTMQVIERNPQNDVTWIYRRHTFTMLVHVHSPSWAEDETVTIEFHRMYLLPLVTDDVAKLTANVDVLVLGFGLHWWYTNDTPHLYRRESYYVSAMRDLFRNVTKQGRVKLLVHRETSAQHFDADGGEFSIWHPQRENRTNACRPMAYTDTSVGWRERAIQRAANESGHSLVMAGSTMPPLGGSHDLLAEVVVLPYFNFTSQHHGMHPHGGDFQDCTHYCSSPYVYYPLWRSLRFAMERQFARSIAYNSLRNSF